MSLAEYDEAHKRCPACGSRDVGTTTMGCLPVAGVPYRNTNRARCHSCNWQGIVHDLTPDAASMQEIQAFVKELVELTDKEIDTWAVHALHRPDRRSSCGCSACQKHMLYTHVVEALERWEKRRNVESNTKEDP